MKKIIFGLLLILGVGFFSIKTFAYGVNRGYAVPNPVLLYSYQTGTETRAWAERFYNGCILGSGCVNHYLFWWQDSWAGGRGNRGDGYDESKNLAKIYSDADAFLETGLDLVIQFVEGYQNISYYKKLGSVIPEEFPRGVYWSDNAYTKLIFHGYDENFQFHIIFPSGYPYPFTGSKVFYNGLYPLGELEKVQTFSSTRTVGDSVRYDFDDIPVLQDPSFTFTPPTTSLSGIQFDFEQTYGLNSGYCTSPDWAGIVNSSVSIPFWSDKSIAVWTYCKNISLVNSGIYEVPNYVIMTGSLYSTGSLSGFLDDFIGGNFEFSSCPYERLNLIKGSIADLPGMSILKDTFIDYNFLESFDCFHTALKNGQIQTFKIYTGSLGVSSFGNASSEQKKEFGMVFSLLLSLPGLVLFYKMLK